MSDGAIYAILGFGVLIVTVATVTLLVVVGWLLGVHL